MDDKAYAATLAISRTLVADDPVTPAPRPPDPALLRGQSLGRYVIVERLGAGGMGVVYTAYDPELDRKVAIKILGTGSGTGSLGEARLLREAKALARLSHPNVVAVHDAGALDGRVFVAMEFVAGATLREHLSRQTWPWRRILELFLAAGRGLAAAHAAGLVHRDFKPDNVLVGADGRVRVLDFGLARASEADGEASLVAPTAPDPPPSSSQSGELGALSSLDSHLTQDGSLVGTPAYMAPEQYLGRPLDARSDQFSFCVALWEAIHGSHPFGEGGALSLMHAITRGKLRAAPRDRKTPAWLPRALARGLSLNPGRRWPDMGALLDELERRAQAARRRRIGGLVGLGVGLLLGTGLWGYALSDSQPSACRGSALRLAGAWGPNRRAEVHAALLATGRPNARATADRVAAGLDAYAAAWAAMREDACLATHDRREQSVELLDLRMTCLGERRDELAALTDLLARAGPEVVDRAVQATAALTPLRRCADPAALTAVAPPPEDPAAQAEIAAIRPRLAAAKAMLDAGRLADGLALAKEAAAEAEALGWRPLVAEALYTLGLLHNRTGDPRLAAVTLERAALAATATRLDELAARAMIELVGSLGVYQARFDDADRWSALAAAMIERLGPSGHVLEAKRLAHTGLVAQIRGDYPAARELHERALALLDRPDRPDPVALVGALSNLGNTLAELGLHAEAEASHRRAVALAEELLGPDHPQLATLLNNLGAALADTGRDDEAAALHARALAIKERALGPDHLSVAASLRNLAQIRARQGDLKAAQAMLRRALAIRERTLGPDHPDLAELLADLADLARRERRLAAADTLLRRALALAEPGGAEHPQLIPILTMLGRVRVDAGRPADAREPLRRALALEPPDQAPARPEIAARLRLALAAALWPEPADRREARALAEQASKLLAAADFADLRAEIDRWLADHPL